MDFYTAKRQFNNYLKDYDCHNDKIRLKIVHTYGVVKESLTFQPVCGYLRKIPHLQR